jgi:cytochrome c553
MTRLIGTLLAVLWSATAMAADDLSWAYPVTPPPEPLNSTIEKQVPGSTKKYTQAQIDDPFNPPDWFPNEHPPMPEIVARGGQKPAGRACAQCHLPSGDGHPESASLAGLPANYIVRQMAAFKNGERKGVRANVMIAMAKVLSDAEVQAAADYFASQKPTRGYNKVIEADKVPATFVGAGGMRFALTDGGFDPIGNRIIVLPQNPERAVLRDPKTGFADFVAKGSIARGAALAAGGDGKTVASRHHRPSGHLYLSSAERYEDGQSQRRDRGTDEADCGQTRPDRHDCTVGLSRFSRSVKWLTS